MTNVAVPVPPAFVALMTTFVVPNPEGVPVIKPVDVFMPRPDGSPTAFTPWLGALAHAVFFRQGSLDYFHTHVCAPGASGCTSVLGAARVSGTSSTPGVLKIGVLVPAPGTWRLFLQLRLGGRIVTAPFTLNVKS